MIPGSLDGPRAGFTGAHLIGNGAIFHLSKYNGKATGGPEKRPATFQRHAHQGAPDRAQRDRAGGHRTG
ncbi:hypothetical protein GCM10023075_56220 [Streptosporangium album]